jgi:hypothetical protein
MPIMRRDRLRWRIRISTLMLLVLVVALSLALFVERPRMPEELPMTVAEAQRANTAGREAPAVAEQARAQAELAEVKLRKELDEAKGAGPKGK